MADDGGHGHGRIEPPGDDADREAWNSFAAAVIASHSEQWASDGGRVILGPTGVEVEVDVRPRAGVTQASLFFDVGGPAVGAPAQATLSGYGPSWAAAVVEGCCMWSTVFVPVLLDGYGGPAALATLDTDGRFQEVDRFTADADGQAYTVAVTSLGRALGQGGEMGGRDRITATHVRLTGGADHLTEVVLADGLLPSFASDRATLLSTFVMDHPDQRTVEVKVNGGVWPAAATVFADRPPEPAGAAVLLRELAVVSPLRPSTTFLGRAALKRTLSGLGQRVGRTGFPEPWPGWVAHGGRLTAAAAAGPGFPDLPLEYVELLGTVGVGGASPGYGLLPPRLVGDVIPLAFAGCGCAWLLRLDDAHRGEVWYDASGSDETRGFVAPSATAWYELWLDAATRLRRPWVQWKVQACAPMASLRQIVQDPQFAEAVGRRDLSAVFRRHSVAISGGGPYLEGGPQPADPCEGCCSAFASWGLGPDVFVPGVLSRVQPPPPPQEVGPAPRSQRWFRR